MAWANDIERMDRAALGQLGGVSVHYAPAVGSAVDITGMFDDQSRLLSFGAAGAPVSPVVFFRLADLPVDPDNDAPRLTIGSKVYKPHEVIRDGQGGISFILHEVAA